MYWNVNWAKKNSQIYIIILVFIFYPPSATKPKALVHKDHTDPCTVINYMRKLRNILLQESRILHLTIIITGFKTKILNFWQTFFDIFLQCSYGIVFKKIVIRVHWENYWGGSGLVALATNNQGWAHTNYQP